MNPAPFTRIDYDRHGRVVRVASCRPVQVLTLHGWNFLLWKRGDAPIDRLCA